MSAWTATKPAMRALRARRSLILAYHGLGPTNAAADPHFLRVPRAAFRAQLDALCDGGFEFVTVSDFVRRTAAAGGTPPPGLIALSFDDGMDDNHTVLLPILREYGIPATVFVTTGLIGKPNPWMDPGTSRMMTDDELRDVHAAGIELGAHTVTHPNLDELDYDACLREMTESRDYIEALVGERPTTFAYPSCKYGDAAIRAARDAGFEAAVTCQWRGSWEPYEMKRVMITGKDGPASVTAKLFEVYGTLFHSAPGRVARTATRDVRRRIRAVRETRV